jgi:hypothetical protein
MIRKEPHALIAGSVLFALAALPIVTLGPAWLAAVRYMSMRERGESIDYRGAARFAFRDRGGAAWLMGLTDALALAMAGGCVLIMLSEEAALALRALYAGLFVLDMTYLASGIYRYSALNDEPDARAGMLAARGFLMTLARPGWTLLFRCAQLLALIVCAATGVGLVMLYPAASALLEAVAYDETAASYTRTDDETEDDDGQDFPDE